jgi:hypothetical protein
MTYLPPADSAVNIFPDTRPVVRLDRTIDHDRPCCQNLATTGPGKGPHGAELRCVTCGRHRGWLPKSAIDFVRAGAEQFGAGAEPIILRDQTIGDEPLKKYDDTDRGALFKNRDKSGDTSPDYKGEINVAGVDYWLKAWIKESKAGEKYMSLSVKPKDSAE